MNLLKRRKVYQMSNKEHEDSRLLAWAANKIRKAQEDGAYGTVVVHLKDGLIIKAERNDSFVPPSPGVLLKDAGS